MDFWTLIYELSRWTFWAETLLFGQNRLFRQGPLSENVHRVNLTEWEQAVAHRQMLDEMPERNVAEMARLLSIDRSTLANEQRVLELPQSVLEWIESGMLSIRAAREFLPLHNADHSHEEVMKYVLDYIADTPQWPGTNDFRPKNVRKIIRRRVTQFPQDWRPLEPAEGDVDYQVFSHTRMAEPQFDTRAFIDEHPELVHHIPRVDEGKSRKWTCAVKEWQRLDQAARDAQKPDPPAEPQQTDMFPQPASGGLAVMTDDAVYIFPDPDSDNAVYIEPAEDPTLDGTQVQANRRQELLQRRLGVWPQIWNLTVEQAFVVHRALIVAYGSSDRHTRDVLEPLIDALDNALSDVGLNTGSEAEAVMQ